MQMRSLRSHRLNLLAAGALLSSPLLVGCGFDYQTDQVNTISAGTNDRDGSVDVLGAVVIAGQDDLGLFVASFVNNDLEEPATFDGLEPTEQISPEGEGEAQEITAAGSLSLFQTGGVEVSGDFTAGDFVDVTLSFSTGQTTTVTVPVVTPCRQYSLDKLTGLTLPGDTGTTPSESPEQAGAGGEESEGVEPDTGEEGATEPGPYSCDAPEPVEHGGEGEGEGEVEPEGDPEPESGE